MRPIFQFIAILLFLIPAVSNGVTLNPKSTYTGYYRVCISDEGISSLLKETQETSKNKNFAKFSDAFSNNPFCKINTYTIEVIQEFNPKQPMNSWNFYYDANSRKNSCNLTVEGNERNVPCVAKLQPAKYYYAYIKKPDGSYYLNSDGTKRIVFAEAFPDYQIYTAYLEDQKKNPTAALSNILKISPSAYTMGQKEGNDSLEMDAIYRPKPGADPFYQPAVYLEDSQPAEILNTQGI